MQESESMKVPAVSTQDDVIDLENPADLLATLLSSVGGTASISKLCKVGVQRICRVSLIPSPFP